jgi:hypothetical protein
MHIGEFLSGSTVKDDEHPVFCGDRDIGDVPAIGAEGDLEASIVGRPDVAVADDQDSILAACGVGKALAVGTEGGPVDPVERWMRLAIEDEPLPFRFPRNVDRTPMASTQGPATPSITTRWRGGFALRFAMSLVNWCSCSLQARCRPSGLKTAAPAANSESGRILPSSTSRVPPPVIAP